MASFIAGFALQQLQDMEQLQRDFGRRRTRRGDRDEQVPIEAPSVLWTLQHQTPRTRGESASTNGATSR
jgi:hypothetical protein